MNNKSTIFHVGYHKTGSSFLQSEVFRKFNKLFYVVPRKDIQELLIYQNDLYYRSENTAIELEKHFIKSREGDLSTIFSEERLSGLPHEGGSDSVQTARRIKLLNPDSKIIIVIRKQEDIIKSSYMQYIVGYGSYSLKEYLNPTTIKKSNLFSYYFFEYHRLIEIYNNLFGSNNVLVLPYELLKKNKKEFIKEILEFINIEIEHEKIIAEIDFSPKNTSSSALYILIKRFFNPFILKGHKNIGNTLHNPLIKYIFKVISFILRKRKISFIDTKISENQKIYINTFCKNKYIKSNRITNGLIKHDLTEYGYQL